MAAERERGGGREGEGERGEYSTTQYTYFTHSVQRIYMYIHVVAYS